MPNSPSSLSQTSASLHRGIKAVADSIGTLLVDAFHYLALFAIGATTVWSAAAAFFGMVSKGRAESVGRRSHISGKRTQGAWLFARGSPRPEATQRGVDSTPKRAE